MTPRTVHRAIALVAVQERLRVHVEQRLELCGLCRRVLALQYHWYADRLPTWSRDRVLGRWMPCPACGYTNFFHTLMYGDAFELKVVPGPEPPSASVDTAPFLRAVYMRLEMFVAWCANRAL